MMSWDSKAVAFIAIVWMALGLLYDTVIGMVTGARAWWAGGVILLLLLAGLLLAERRRAAVHRTRPIPATAGRHLPATQPAD